MRLQRALARSGVASRRAAEDLIRSGRVSVNGKLAELGMSVDPQSDVIIVGRRRVKPVQQRWIALNKPVGYVVTRRDPRGWPTVFELLPELPGLIYVGRLDVMTGGLLLLTTDGTAANRLTHPRYHVTRSYRVLVHGRPDSQIRKALSCPIRIDGRPVRVLRYRLRRAKADSIDLTLVLAEGRNRIVRRLCARLSLKVEHLTRLSYGSVRLGRLRPGKWRYLSESEIESLTTLDPT